MGAKLSYPADVNLTGKTVIVTGSNTGIGYETAKAISFLGAHTIIACRSEERATQVYYYYYRLVCKNLQRSVGTTQNYGAPFVSKLQKLNCL